MQARALQLQTRALARACGGLRRLDPIPPTPAAGLAAARPPLAAAPPAPHFDHRQRQPQRSGGALRAYSSGGGGPGTMPLRYRPPIVIRPQEQHTATMIMLHGLGDSGEGWAPVGDELAPELPNVKFVFPHAPMRPITLNMGMTMPGWYDISSLDDLSQREDEPGLMESMRYVESLVAAEAAEGVHSERVVVGGFSQGGAVALLMLRSQKKLAGIVGLSTYLPLRNEEGITSPANAGTPIFQAHGDADMVVNYSFGVAAHRTLKDLGADAEFITVRGMGHSAVPAELAAMAEFVKKCVQNAA